MSPQKGEGLIKKSYIWPNLMDSAPYHEHSCDNVQINKCQYNYLKVRVRYAQSKVISASQHINLLYSAEYWLQFASPINTLLL